MDSIRIISSASGTVLKEIRPTGNIVWGVGFSPDGSEIASISGSDRRTLEFWDIASGARKGADRHAGAVREIEFVNGNRLASFGDDGKMKIWDLQKQRPVGELTGQHFDISGGGSAAYGTPAHLFDLRKTPPAGVVLTDVHPEAAAAGWTSSGNLVVADFFNQKIVLFDEHGKAQSKLALSKPLTGLDFVRAVGAAPSRPEIFFGGGGYRSYNGSQNDAGFVGVWLPPATTWKFLNKTLSLPVQEFVTLTSGKVFALAYSFNDYALYDAETGKELSRVPNSRFALQSHAVSPNGKYIAFGGEKKTVLLWDTTTQQFKKLTGDAIEGKPENIPAPSNPAECRMAMPISGLVSTVSFSPDGSTLASSDPDCGVNLWSVKSGTHLRKLGTELSDRISSLSFSRDGKLLAGGLQDGSIRVWNVSASTIR